MFFLEENEVELADLSAKWQFFSEETNMVYFLVMKWWYTTGKYWKC